MEMNLADRPAVNLAFRFRDQAVNRFCVGFHPVGNSQAVDQRFDISGGSMVVMSVVMRVLMAFVMVMLMYLPHIIRGIRQLSGWKHAAGDENHTA